MISDIHMLNWQYVRNYRKKTNSGVARIANETSFFGTSFSYPRNDELRGVLFWSAWIFVLALNAPEPKSPPSESRHAGWAQDRVWSGRGSFSLPRGMFQDKGKSYSYKCGLHLSPHTRSLLTDRGAWMHPGV